MVVACDMATTTKPVTAILPAHQAELHTCLRMSDLRVGLILTFNAPRLTQAIRRYLV
jgi:hypothetical protein